MKTVFVVLGEQGEYSDRSVWCSGVFETREAAEATIRERLAIRREYNNWHEIHYRTKRPPTPEKPEYEPADRVELIEMPLNSWQGCHWIKDGKTAEFGA